MVYDKTVGRAPFCMTLNNLIRLSISDGSRTRRSKCKLVGHCTAQTLDHCCAWSRVLERSGHCCSLLHRSITRIGPHSPNGRPIAGTGPSLFSLIVQSPAIVSSTWSALRSRYTTNFRLVKCSAVWPREENVGAGLDVLSQGSDDI